MLSGGATRNVATWRVLVRGVKGMTLGFPVGFSIVFFFFFFLPKFKTSPFLISFTFQKAKQKHPNGTPSVFLKTSFFSKPLCCALVFRHCRYVFSYRSFPYLFPLSYCSVVFDSLFLFFLLLWSVFDFLGDLSCVVFLCPSFFIFPWLIVWRLG